MRRSRQFRPEGPAALEDRVVLSHVSPFGHHAPHVKLPAAVQSHSNNPSPENVLKGSVGNFHGLNLEQTLKAGNPVYESITTRFSDGTTQTENRLITPDKSTHTVTTAKNITLRNNAGQERIVDVATTTGATVNHQITITLPGGATETETRTDLLQGDKTPFKATLTLPGGSLRTFTGTTTVSGDKSTTDETMTDPEGFVTKTTTVVTVHDELSQSTTTTTTYPDGTSTTSNSNTFVLRLQPPF